jgi:hypothetical protein
MSVVRLVALVLLVAVAGGCGGDPAPPAAAPAGSSAADEWGDPAPAAAGGRSAPACDLPVTFDIAAKWVPKPVAADVAAEFGGPDRVACEVDAKPAGVIGFLRVYVATLGDARAALEAHVAGGSSQANEQRSRQITTPAGTGWEISYRTEDSLVRAFAVPAATGAVVVEWGGIDEAEHRSGLPAYVLARASLTGR